MIYIKSFGFEFYPYFCTPNFTTLVETKIIRSWGRKAGLINDELGRIWRARFVLLSQHVHEETKKNHGVNS